MPARDDQKGHRERLRERFLADSGAAMPDYELLELILFLAIPRRDTKGLAKMLIDRFGSLQAVLAAEPGELCAVEGISEASTVAIKACHQAGLRLAYADIRERELLGSWDRVLDYCRAHLAHTAGERFHILFLDRKNRLIRAEEQSRGTVDQTSVYPREVIKRALELGASAIIMVHNHPSGDPTPSEADIAITRAVQAAGAAVGIALHDHVVIARGSHVSLRTAGILQEFPPFA